MKQSLPRSILDDNYGSPLACLVKNKATRRSPTKYVGDGGSIRFTNFSSPREGGDRYIPLRESEEQWSTAWNEGLHSSVFDRVYEESSKGKVYETKSSSNASRDNYVHKALLCNEMLNSNIYKIERKSPHGYNSTTDKVQKPQPLFRYGYGRIQKRRNDFTKPNIVPFYPCPFSRASLHLLTQNFPKMPKMPTESYRTLDAPDLVDDYYSNLIDWSSRNIIAVCLKNRLYLYDALTSEVTQLCDTTEDIASVKFNPSGEHIAFGMRSGEIKVWDIEKKAEIYSHENLYGRIGNLAWNNRGILTLATKSGYIINRDIKNYEKIIHKWKNHKYEVCGVQWNQSGELLASGGNDNVVNIWSLRGGKPQATYNEHAAAVKALAWSYKNDALLATGGGTSCKTIYIRDTNTNAVIKSVKTNSQICTLLWSKNTCQFVTTHGYQEHSVVVWDYPTMKPATLLKGHNGRVLYSAMSPDGQSVITGSNDESLRWWKLFPKMSRSGSRFRSKILPFNFVR